MCCGYLHVLVRAGVAQAQSTRGLSFPVLILNLQRNFLLKAGAETVLLFMF